MVSNFWTVFCSRLVAEILAETAMAGMQCKSMQVETVFIAISNRCSESGEVGVKGYVLFVASIDTSGTSLNEKTDPIAMRVPAMFVDTIVEVGISQKSSPKTFFHNSCVSNVLLGYLTFPHSFCCCNRALSSTLYAMPDLLASVIL